MTTRLLALAATLTLVACLVAGVWVWVERAFTFQIGGSR